MGKNNMIKCAVRDMIKNNPDKLAERLSVILSIDDCNKLCNGFVYDVMIRGMYTFAKKYDLPTGKVFVDNIEICDDAFTVCCTINNDEDGEKSTTKKRITESFDNVDENVYYITRI